MFVGVKVFVDFMVGSIRFVKFVIIMILVVKERFIFMF